MKRLIFTIISIGTLLSANAQMARWLISPSYDDIRIAANGIDAVVTDSAGVKNLWTYEGKLLIKTSNDLFDFKDKRCVSTKKGKIDIDCIYTENGEKIKIENCNVTHAFPYYSCGMLLVHDGSYFRYVQTDGSIDSKYYLKAYPFFNGYASCQTFMNMEKKKNPYNLLIDNNEKAVEFKYGGKNIDANDVEFISSVNDDSIAVVVIKHKVYTFDGRTKILSPVCATKDDDSQKNQAKLNGDLAQCYKQLNDSISTLTAECGKINKVTFSFDNFLKPVSIDVNGNVETYSVKTEKKKEYTSSVKSHEENGLYGIYYNSKEILPPQFDRVMSCIDNKVFVKLKGKYGMLEVDSVNVLKVKINKGDDIAFLHQKKDATVRVDMPHYILADKTYLEFCVTEGAELDKTSRTWRNTESGNFVEYNCVLTIPKDLPDEIKEITYPVQITYDGLKYPVIDHKVNAWFYKKFEIEEDESQRNVEHGTLTFVFNVKNSREDESIVKFDVSVQADTLSVLREDKMSETRYKYKVCDLKEGVNNIVVQVLEQGCPPASFPFEVEYHKPVAKTKTKPAEKEKVNIVKKQKVQPSPTPTLILKI